MAAPTPDKRLIGVRAKTERAKQHIREFERVLQSFRGTDPYGVVAENDTQTGDRIYKTKTRAPIPLELSLIAGEVIHQLRSSLDHLAWQLVEANGKSPGQWTCFPISDTAAEYKTQSPGRVPGMSAGAISLINATQPYQGGNDDLWALHKLNNIDKHRHLLVAAFGAAGPIMRLYKGRFGGSQVVIKAHGFHEARQDGKVIFLEDGTEIGRIVGCAESEVNTDLNVSFDIAFGERQVVPGKPVLPFLRQLSHLVDAVVNQFVPFL